MRSVQLDRLNSGGAVLLSHDMREQIGVVDKARIDTDRVGRAVLRFSKSVQAQEIFQDVADGIRKNISVGYRILKFTEEKVEGKADQIRVMLWEPMEISMVAIPADTSVGVGREYFNFKNKENGKMTQGLLRDEREWSPVQKEQSRVSGILTLVEQFGPDLQEAGNRYIKEGRSLGEFKRLVIERQKSDNQEDIEFNFPGRQMGLDSQNLQDYSIVKMLRGQISKNWDECGLELEVSRHLQKTMNRQANGLLIPMEVLMSRDVSKGTSGGNLVATNLLSSQFIDLLRPRSVAVALGARVMSGLVGDIDIPRALATSSTTWITEGGATLQSDPSYDKVSLSPKTITTKSKVTRKMLLQSTPDIDSLIRDDLMTAIGIGIDAAAISGSGVGSEPTGILNAPGVGLVALGTNGAVPTWDSIVQLEEAVAAANQTGGAYATSVAARSKLKRTEKFTGTNGQSIWPDGRDLDGFSTLNSYRALASMAAPSNLSKGTGSNLSALIFGEWDNLLIGQWGVLDVQADPYTFGDEGAHLIRVFQDTDIALRRPAAFAVIKDAITA